MTATHPLSRGVHHLALNTDDMKVTLDFYTRVLGMPLVHALKVPPGLGTGPANRGNPPFENLRHYFLDAGGDSLLAFFEMPKGQPRGDRNAIGTMQHVSFAVSEERFSQVRKNVEKAQIPYLGPINVGCDTWSMYFYDPNGIRLEFSHQRESEPKVVTRWRQTRAEALAELRTLSQDPAWLEGMVAHLPVNGAARRAGKPRKAPGRKRSSARRTGPAAQPSRRPRTGRRPARG